MNPIGYKKSKMSGEVESREHELSKDAMELRMRLNKDNYGAPLSESQVHHLSHCFKRGTCPELIPVLQVKNTSQHSICQKYKTESEELDIRDLHPYLDGTEKLLHVTTDTNVRYAGERQDCQRQ